MKKWNLFAAIFQIVVGIAAIVAYIVVAASAAPFLQIIHRNIVKYN